MPVRLPSRMLLCCVIALFPILSGCRSAKKEEPRGLVSGAVTVNGNRLTTGWVTFYPDEERDNHSTRLPIAEIKPDGTYEASTNSKPGAPCGFYKVVVAASRDPLPLKPPRNPDGTPKGIHWLTHEKYTRPDSTDLRIEVVAEPSPGQYDLALER